MKIKIKYHSNSCRIVQYGDWIDLRSEHTVIFSPPKLSKDIVKFDNKLVSLGVSMQLPKHYEAHLVPRSSTFRSYRVLQTNGMGIIDSTYCGDNDVWKMPVVALDRAVINNGDRICQFRIMPSQNAPWWVKLNWLISKKVKFEEVEHLGRVDRGGFGSSGNK